MDIHHALGTRGMRRDPF